MRYHDTADASVALLDAARAELPEGWRINCVSVAAFEASATLPDRWLMYAVHATNGTFRELGTGRTEAEAIAAVVASIRRIVYPCDGEVTP